MKKLVTLSMFGLMSVGVFASNEGSTKGFFEANVEHTNSVETLNAVKAQITLNCEDGSSYTVSCDSCTTGQLIGIAWALCN
ncbi:MAG TPA: hypothetical protein VKZ45_06140 [Vicingaceae bacterium]|nr:hypothetical protein [Vicingaceae bacterium]